MLLKDAPSHIGELSRPLSSFAEPSVLGAQYVSPGTGFDPRQMSPAGCRMRYVANQSCQSIKSFRSRSTIHLSPYFLYIYAERGEIVQL
eukprot:SAG31_NODE_3024_length_4780_cov_2.631275_4_plen_89_part_00